MILSSGQQIGNYRVIRPLGQGGMATVYEVEHIKLGVRYALKTFTLEEGHVELFRKRFSVEGKILARLNHPNLVRVIDLDLDETLGVLYYVMDLIEGVGDKRTLADVKPGEANEETVFCWFQQLCDALAYVHAQGIVHRDIKLNNILLAPDGHVVLSDFGISRVTDDNLRSAVSIEKTIVTGMTTGNVAMGTQGYMAPEVLRGEPATPASDVYSLGVAFFRLLTNVWYDPCLAPSADKDSAVGMNSVKLLEPFEYRWVDVLPVMLNERPEERPTNLTELPDYLPPPVAEPSKKSHRGWFIAASVALLLAAAGGYGWWRFATAPKTISVEDLYEIPQSVSNE